MYFLHGLNPQYPDGYLAVIIPLQCNIRYLILKTLSTCSTHITLFRMVLQSTSILPDSFPFELYLLLGSSLLPVSSILSLLSSPSRWLVMYPPFPAILSIFLLPRTCTSSVYIRACSLFPTIHTCAVVISTIILYFFLLPEKPDHLVEFQLPGLHPPFA